MNKICLLSTGGTIEKSYSEEIGELHNKESLIKAKLLQKLRLPSVDIDVKALMAKDSLVMTDEDRKKIVEGIKEAQENCSGMVILHGTDTLHLSIKYCSDQLTSPKVPIVFTGAMKPAGFDDSDALQNFTEALLACQIVKPGYYLAFHGQLFSGPEVTKNRDKGTFEGAAYKAYL